MKSQSKGCFLLRSNVRWAVLLKCSCRWASMRRSILFAAVPSKPPSRTRPRDVALELVEGLDLVHRDVVPARLAAADEQGADGAVLVQDGGQGPDVEVRVEGDPVARAVRQLQGVPELLLAVGEEGQAGGVGGRDRLAAVLGDEVEVAEQGRGLVLGGGESAGPVPGLADEVLQGELDLLLVQPALVRVQVERRHEIALALELGQRLDLGTVL